MREIRFIDQTQTKALKEALSLVRHVFWEFNAQSYSDEGVMEFSDYIEFSAMHARMERGEVVMLGCYENKRLAGVIGLRVPSHICLMFVAKPYQRRGVAGALLQAVIRCVRQLSGETEISVNASPYAALIYQKMGFVPTDDERVLNGLRFVPMAFTIT